MVNKSETIINWQMPKECQAFDKMLTSFDDENALSLDVIENMLKSQTKVPEFVNQLLYHLAEFEMMEKAIDMAMNEQQSRKERYAKRSESVKIAIKMIFDKYDLKKMECPFGTVTKVVKEKSKLEVTDEKMIRDFRPDLFIEQEPKLDRAALKDDLMNDIEVVGARMVDSQYIQVRK